MAVSDSLSDRAQKVLILPCSSRQGPTDPAGPATVCENARLGDFEFRVAARRGVLLEEIVPAAKFAARDCTHRVLRKRLGQSPVARSTAVGCYASTGAVSSRNSQSVHETGALRPARRRCLR